MLLPSPTQASAIELTNNFQKLKKILRVCTFLPIVTMIQMAVQSLLKRTMTPTNPINPEKHAKQV